MQPEVTAFITSTQTRWLAFSGWVAVLLGVAFAGGWASHTVPAQQPVIIPALPAGTPRDLPPRDLVPRDLICEDTGDCRTLPPGWGEFYSAVPGVCQRGYLQSPDPDVPPACFVRKLQRVAASGDRPAAGVDEPWMSRRRSPHDRSPHDRYRAG